MASPLGCDLEIMLARIFPSQVSYTLKSLNLSYPKSDKARINELRSLRQQLEG
jgi:hypothetical protein